MEQCGAGVQTDMGSSAMAAAPLRNRPYQLRSAGFIRPLLSLSEMVIAVPYGALGDGTRKSSSVPVKVSGLMSILGLGAGASHTCAVDRQGRVLCWGGNFAGQVGSGTSGDSVLSPAPVIGIGTAKTVQGGLAHTCALLNDGHIHCWGANWGGQLGNGTRTDSSLPVAVSVIDTARQVTVGYQHTCAVVEGGAVMCWGNNLFAHLSKEGPSLPKPIVVNVVP